MSKFPKRDNLDAAKRIAARMLAMPPESQDEMKSGRKAKPKTAKSLTKRATGKRRVKA